MKSITKIVAHNIVNHLIYCLFDMFVWMENEFHILVDLILNNELSTNSYINTLSNEINN